MNHWATDGTATRLRLSELIARPMTRCLRVLYVAYTFMLVLLPSGSIFGVNIKIACFALLLPVTLQVALTKLRFARQHLLALLYFPAVLFAWVLLSQWYGFDAELALAQYKDVIVMIATCWFAAVLADREQSQFLFILRTLVCAEVFTSAFKILLLVYALAMGIPISEIIEAVDRIFGVHLMNYEFGPLLGRLQFNSDSLIPICIFTIICCRPALKFRTGWALSMVFLLLLSVCFSFSRFLWAFTVVAIVTGLILGKKERFQAALLGIVSIAVLAALPLLTTLISLRFSETVVTSSDIDRSIQMAALQAFFRDAVWFGHGFGSYTTRVIRNESSPYSYEIQLLALCGQIGVIGVATLLIAAAYYFRRLLPSDRQEVLRSAGLALMLLTWIVGGFLNPSVISSAASLCYVAIYAMSHLKRSQVQPNVDHAM